MPKRIPTEERKFSTTFAISVKTLALLDELEIRAGENRSRIAERAIISYYYRWIAEHDPKDPEPAIDFYDEDELAAAEEVWGSDE